MIESGLIHKVHSKINDDNDVVDVEDSETKSSLVQVSNLSSAMGSASCDKVCNQNKHDNFFLTSSMHKQNQFLN